MTRIERKKVLCNGCDGTGVSRHGNKCWRCSGTGIRPMDSFERKELRRQMALEFAGGALLEDVCESYGVTPTTVANACREFGVKRHLKRRAPSTLPNKVVSVKVKFTTFKILSALLRGVSSQSEIAHEFGVSPQYVHQVKKMAIEAGIKLPRKG